MSASLFGEYLRFHRVQAGLSVRGLATLVGVDHVYISRLEQGQKTNPSADVLVRIAAALKLDDASELLTLFGIAPERSLPSARTYFRRKYGLSSDDADKLARLVEDYTQPPHNYQSSKEINHEP